MNSRKIVIYNSPYNCVQFELVLGSPGTNSSKAYLQLANYSGEDINWKKAVSIELTLSIVIDMVVILHNLRGTKKYDDLGHPQKKNFKFGFATSEHYGYSLWIELKPSTDKTKAANEQEAASQKQITKPRLLLTTAGRLGDIISLKAFLIGVLNTYLLERTGISYSVSEIINQLLNPEAISNLGNRNSEIQ